MTFCLAMKVRDGLVGLADTRITSGSEPITAPKLTVQQHGRHSMFLMTSGLRSVRDKAMTYFEEVLAERDVQFRKLYQAVNAFAQQVRAVAAEDKQALRESKLSFNLSSLIGGQLEDDREPKLYLLYPQANWVEVTTGTPYFVIGETGYGKPLLDRMLTYETGMDVALKIGYLAFDATRTSSTNVGFPIDVVVYRRDSYEMIQNQYEEDELAETSEWWNGHLAGLVSQIPSRWIESVFTKGGRPKVRRIP